MTVVVEVDSANADTNININFGKNINKTFGKYVYEIPKNTEIQNLFDGNAVLPTKITDLNISGTTLNDSIGNNSGVNYPDLNCDNLTVDYAFKSDDEAKNAADLEKATPKDYKGNSGHYLVIYTTLDEQEQIALDDVLKYADSGDTVQFNITDIYGTDCSDVTWSVITDQNGNKPGTIDQNGLYNSVGTVSGDTVAIKAELNDGSGLYAVGIVQIN